MATFDDARAIALSLPGATEVVDGHRGGACWRTRNGRFAWERGPSKKDLTDLRALERAWPDGDVLALRTDGLPEKEALLASFPEIFFTIPHFDGWPAVLVDLDRIEVGHLREAVTEAWLVAAPAHVAKAWLAEHPELGGDVGGGS